MIGDEGLVHRAFVCVDANFRSDVTRVRGGEGKPFIVKRETQLRVSGRIGVGTESGHCTEPRFLDENDVEIIVIRL